MKKINYEETWQRFFGKFSKAGSVTYLLSQDGTRPLSSWAVQVIVLERKALDDVFTVAYRRTAPHATPDGEWKIGTLEDAVAEANAMYRELKRAEGNMMQVLVQYPFGVERMETTKVHQRIGNYAITDPVGDADPSKFVVTHIPTASSMLLLRTMRLAVAVATELSTVPHTATGMGKNVVWENAQAELPAIKRILHKYLPWETNDVE